MHATAQPVSIQQVDCQADVQASMSLRHSKQASAHRNHVQAWLELGVDRLGCGGICADKFDVRDKRTSR